MNVKRFVVSSSIAFFFWYVGRILNREWKDGRRRRTRGDRERKTAENWTKRVWTARRICDEWTRVTTNEQHARAQQDGYLVMGVVVCGNM